MFYNFDDKFYYELGLANIRLNKEQKHNVKLACGLIRDSLWEPEINEIKNCVEKFSDYHKQANGKLIAGSDHPMFKGPATKVFRKELLQSMALLLLISNTINSKSQWNEFV